MVLKLLKVEHSEKYISTITLIKREDTRCLLAVYKKFFIFEKIIFRTGPVSSANV